MFADAGVQDIVPCSHLTDDSAKNFMLQVEVGKQTHWEAML